MPSKLCQSFLVQRWATWSVLFCLLQATVFGQLSADSILSRVRAEVMKHQSVSYAADVQTKFSNMPDTFACHGTVMLDRVEADSAFGGRIRFTTDDTTWTLYDLSSIYTCDPRTDSCLRYDVAKHMDWPIESNTCTFIRWRSFQKPMGMDYWAKQTTAKILLEDTLLGKEACWHIRVHTPDQANVTNDFGDLFVSKTGFVPLLQMGHLLLDGDVQYYRVQMHDVLFDHAGPEAFDISSVVPHAVITDYKLTEEAPLLAIGRKAPQLVGDIYGSSPAADTVNFSGHITMVDFWYISCPPCRSSVPMIDSLRSVYEGRGVRFVGVDCWDGPTGGLALLPEFIQKHSLNYPVLLADKSIEEEYSVTGHPAFFIVGVDGNIAYNQEGYGPDLPKVWGAKLDELLGK